MRPDFEHLPPRFITIDISAIVAVVVFVAAFFCAVYWFASTFL
jgi:hypothetical protein